MSSIVLQTEGLTKRFKGRTAVDRLTMSVERGDIYGFLGPNGAGKSTTLRMLLGLVRPTSGVIKFSLRESSWEYLKARSRVGAIIETPAFYENFSARRNLQLLASLSGGVASTRVEEVLEIVDLRDRAGDRVKVFSYGMRQRLGIAQALLPTPDLIILDDVLSALDATTERNIIKNLIGPKGLFKELKSRRYYEKPSERRKRKHKESVKKIRKEESRMKKNSMLAS